MHRLVGVGSLLQQERGKEGAVVRWEWIKSACVQLRLSCLYSPLCGDSDGENQVKSHRAYLVQTPLLISTDIRHHPGLCQGYGLSTNPGGPSPTNALEALALCSRHATCGHQGAVWCGTAQQRGLKPIIQLPGPQFSPLERKGESRSSQSPEGMLSPTLCWAERSFLQLSSSCMAHTDPDQQLLLVPHCSPRRCSARGLYSPKKLPNQLPGRAVGRGWRRS